MDVDEEYSRGVYQPYFVPNNGPLNGNHRVLLTKAQLKEHLLANRPHSDTCGACSCCHGHRSLGCDNSVHGDLPTIEFMKDTEDRDLRCDYCDRYFPMYKDEREGKWKRLSIFIDNEDSCSFRCLKESLDLVVCSQCRECNYGTSLSQTTWYIGLEREDPKIAQQECSPQKLYNFFFYRGLQVLCEKCYRKEPKEAKYNFAIINNMAGLSGLYECNKLRKWVQKRKEIRRKIISKYMSIKIHSKTLLRSLAPELHRHVIHFLCGTRENDMMADIGDDYDNLPPPLHVHAFGTYVLDIQYRKELYESNPQLSVCEFVGSYLGYNPYFPSQYEWEHERKTKDNINDTWIRAVPIAQTDPFYGIWTGPHFQTEAQF